MDIDALIQQHKTWKNLVESLFSEQNSGILNSTALSKDSDCELGQWLGSKASMPFLFEDNFDKLKELHADFHYLAGKIIFEFQAAKIEEAEKLIPKFRDTSVQLISMLEELKTV